MESLLKLCFGFSAVLFLIFLLPNVAEFSYRKKAHRLGCEPAKTIDRWFPLGLPMFFRIATAHQKNRLGHLFLKQFECSGFKTFRTCIIGNRVITTADSENIKAMLATQFRDFCLGNRIDIFGPLLGSGIFTLDGTGWSHSRAMLRPQFTRDQISHLSTIENHTSKIIEIANAKYKQSEEFDIQEVFFRFTLDTATEFLFGESVEALTENNPRHDAVEFAYAFNHAQEYCSLRFRAQRFSFLFNSKLFQHWNKVCQKFVDYYVHKALTDEKINGLDDRYIFLYALARQTKNPIILRDQCLNILLAGRDTTASTLSMGFYMLALYPHVFKKLRVSILNEFGTDINKISFESLKRATYLQNFITEVLRLFPVVPNNARTAVRDTTLPRGGGHDGMSPVLVEKGTDVFYSVFSMHRLKEYYGEDAEEFRPERWERSYKSWEYLPFNGGPRICLGQQLALTELSYVFVRLLQSFKQIIATPDQVHQDPDLKMNITLCASEGVNLKLVPADSF